MRPTTRLVAEATSLDTPQVVAATPTLDASAPSRREVAGIWGRHLLSLYLPANALLFLWTGPHTWYVAFLFMAPLVAAHQLDCAPRYERRQPPPALPAWPFDALVYGLAALQLWLVFELVRLFSVQGIFSFDALIAFFVVGGSSGFSIVTAHELIHRRRRWERNLGRLLLCTVLYEHFFTEHIRGHHARVGTPADPATARFGESYESFFRRTVPGQLRSAWRLERERLGDPAMGLFDRRMLRNRILHGLALEWGVALLILLAFGAAAFLAFVLQAFSAIRLLEAVNYFEHWGITRRGPKPRPEDSWDTHSWFTYYALIGLTRHADHHSTATRPYQRLRVREEAPLMPFGYVAMVDLAMGRNADFQELATAELAERRLGPFAEGAGDPRSRLRDAQARETGPEQAAGPAARRWRRLPGWLRVATMAAGLLLVTTVGVQWETGGQQMGFAARLALHGWMLGAFVLALGGRHRIVERTGENLSWVFAFAVILAAGAVSSLLF